MIVNAAGCRILKGAGIKYAVFLWDESAGKMAIKAATKGKDSFAITFGRGSGAFSAFARRRKCCRLIACEDDAAAALACVAIEESVGRTRIPTIFKN